MKQRVTIDDVAEKVGVSRQTVSRAVNDQDGISATTRARVIKAVNELGYRPSRIAQGMAGSRTRTIGVVIDDLTNLAKVQSLRGITDFAESQDYNVFIRHTQLKHNGEVEALQALAAEGVDAILILSTAVDIKQVSDFADTFWPVVLVHCQIDHPHISYLKSDVKKASKTVVEYLFGSGHKTIGLVTREGDADQIGHVQGYKRAYQVHGTAVNTQWIVQAATTLEGGKEATLKLLNEQPEITAVFAYNDSMAIGAMRACHELGKAIPKDVAIFGFNDLEVAAYTIPTLSTVRYNDYLLGSRAMELALTHLDHPDKNVIHNIVDVELVLRESTTLE